VLGVNLYALHNEPAAQVEVDGQRTISYIKNDLKANAISIVWHYFQNRDSDNAVHATKDTLSAANVAILTKIAKRYHLRVEYRPLVFTHETNTWEGRIDPTHPVKWFRSYFHAERPYLKVAQQQNVKEFVTATEMNLLHRSPLWPSFFKRVARIYKGLVSYSAWDHNYFDPPIHLLPVKQLGMDMYLPVKLPPNASAKRVTAAWERPFRKLPRSVLHRTAIDETGIQARNGAYRNPPFMFLPGTENENVQANWFHAACATVHRFHMRGVYFWKVDLTDYPAHPATSLSTFEGRKAARTIASCARILH
jgi:hypothetical protein